MAKKKHKAYDLKFSVRNHSVPGIVAAFFALASVGTYVGCIIYSADSHGEAGLIVGAAGMIGLIVSFATFVVGCTEIMKHEEYFKLFPVSSIVLSVIGLLCWIGMIVLGCI
jgi:fluoride ion exporter CrcB/FEX